MENNKKKIPAYITMLFILCVSLFFAYYCWSLVKSNPLVHQNNSSSSYGLKETTLKNIKNPPSLDYKQKNDKEGRINPFTPY